MADRGTGRITMEVLAPAGGREQLVAAVRCGADAVYLGTKGFNARGNAENFADLSEAVAYCHARNVRVYVAVNTLVMDDELPALLDTLSEVQRAGADAAIVQDLAVAALIRERCPGLELHASTQMTIHNAAGLKALKQLGFSRAVLARELTLPEIRAIHDAAEGVALEAFIHGALCMSVSGACYLSSMLGGRSGNRGLCAQPCRLDFASGGRAYALSLKDLSALQHIQALYEAGISAVKIEGRMRRPEYVAAAVTAVRDAMAGRTVDLGALRSIFSRSGFTDGYLTGKRNLSMFGVRTEADAEASRHAQGAYRALYQRERPSVPVTMRLSLSEGASVLHATDGERCAQANGDAPETARSTALDAERARRSLEKMGDTPFFLASLDFQTDGPFTLPASALNAMRREALDSLLSARSVPRSRDFAEGPLPHFAAHAIRPVPLLYVRLETEAQLFDSLRATRVILPLERITSQLLARFGERLAAEIPAVLFPSNEQEAAQKLLSLKQGGLSAAYCENIGALRLAREAGLTAIGGAGLNILNSAALQVYASLGLQEATVSFELHSQRIKRLESGIPRGAVSYGHLPLMRLRTCPAQGPHGCGSCTGQPFLTDRKGMRFPLQCHGKRFVTLLNPIPLNLSGEPLSGIDYQLLYFTLEDSETVRTVIERFEAGKVPDGNRTRGLYYRKLL